MTGLTDRQQDCLDAIRAHLREFGRPPTYEQIGRAINVTGKGSIHRLVHGLAQRGAIRITPRLRQSIEVVEHARLDDGMGFLPHDLAVWARVTAARAGVKPLDVVTEAVRDAYMARRKPEQNVPRETSAAA